MSRRIVGLGVLAGNLPGMIGGPEGLLIWAVPGAIVGSQLDTFCRRPIPTEDLRRLAGQMQPDSSGILTLVGEKQAQELVDAMAGYAEQVVTLTVDDRVGREIV